MSISSEISSRFWNLPRMAEIELSREESSYDDLVLKYHTEKEILSNLNGIKTVFDGGAGYGRFSILLAKKGLDVTHFDISHAMIDKAKEIAHREGVLDKMTLIHGSLEDITQFADKQFDMVLSFDSPISYTYPNHEEVIKNLIRICSKRLIISVYNRVGGYMLHAFKHTLKQKPHENIKDFLPDIQHAFHVLETGLADNPEEVIAKHEKGETTWPLSYSFTVSELLFILEKNGAGNVKLSGPGALLRSIPNEVLMNIFNDEKAKSEFLDFCYAHDSQSHCEGMGMTNIIASAEIYNG